MKRFFTLKLTVFAAMLVQGAGCTLSTTGLREPADPSLAYRATSEVYDKKSAAKPAPAAAERP